MKFSAGSSSITAYFILCLQNKFVTLHKLQLKAFAKRFMQYLHITRIEYEISLLFVLFSQM